jgi:hypothetical protein
MKYGPELLEALRPFSKIIVTGPQRSGTRIGGIILAADLERLFLGEDEFNDGFIAIDDLRRFSAILKQQPKCVVQAPQMSHACHLIQGAAIVFMMRDTNDIVRSERRIKWGREEHELSKYNKAEGPISVVKCAAWKAVQKECLNGRGFELEYESLQVHEMWREPGNRGENLISLPYGGAAYLNYELRTHDGKTRIQAAN